MPWGCEWPQGKPVLLPGGSEHLEIQREITELPSVVLQCTVEQGAQPFDLVGFFDCSLQRALSWRVCEVFGLAQHFQDMFGMTALRSEVTVDAVFEGFCFSHIKDIPV